MKHIGVVSHLRLPDLPTELKRYALFFDEVQIVSMTPEAIREKNKFFDAQVAAEIDYLYENGFLKEGVFDLKSTEGLPPELAAQYALNAHRIAVANEYMDRTREISTRMSELLEMIGEWKETGEDPAPLIALYNKLAELSARGLVEGIKAFPQSARQVAMNLSLFEGQSAVCLGELDYRSAGDNPGPVTPDTIYEIAVSGMPVPDLTSWEDIIALKADSQNQRKLRAFHVWVSDMGKSGQTKAEMTDRIEWLKEEYLDALKVAKMKHYPSVLKCMVVGSMGLIENAVKFKLTDMAKGFSRWRGRGRSCWRRRGKRRGANCLILWKWIRRCGDGQGQGRSEDLFGPA
jgi:hypothetical protein